MNRTELIKNVKAAQAGDRGSFERLYSAYRDRLWFFVNKNVGSEALTEDIVSEAFTTALERIGELRAAEAFGSWLYTIAFNECRRQMSIEGRSTAFESEEQKQLLLDNAALNEPVMLPDDYAANAETKRRLGEIIDGLSPDQRSAVILYYYEELSIPEVAKALGINENNARQKLFKARSRIKKQIEKLVGSGALLSAVPLGAVLENTADQSYSKAALAGAARVAGTGLSLKLAAVGAAAAVAAGTALAVGRFGNMGDRGLSDGPVISDSSEAGPADEDDPAQEDIPISQNVLHWAVPNSYRIEEDTLRAFNQKLYAEGHDFAVEFVPLTDDLGDNSDYYWLLLSEGGIDLAFSGFGSDNGTDVSGDLIRGGYFAELSELKAGNGLFDAYSEKLWDTTRVGGKLYTVPNAALRYDGISYIFNMSYFGDTAQQVEDFDLEFSSLGELISEAEVYRNSDEALFENGLILDVSADRLLEADGSVYEKGLLLSAESGKAEPVFESSEMERLEATLHSYMEQGLLSSRESLSTRDWEQIKKQLTSGEFTVYITADLEALEQEGVQIKEPYLVRTTRPCIRPRLTGTTGIAAKSEHKAEALELLELVYTDSEYLRLLVEEEPEEGAPTEPSLIKELIIGSDNTDGSITDKKQYFDSGVEVSPFIGRTYSLSGTDIDVQAIATQTGSLLDIWREEDFESAYSAAKGALGLLRADELAEHINEQLLQGGEQ